MVTSDVQADIGVIGGSGLYELLVDAEPVGVDTPFGAPSEPPVVATLGGKRVAFIPRHGADHRMPPHRVPYRANLWALRALGVRQVVAASAVGGLRPDVGPGQLVVPDQLVDRTSGRADTYYDDGAVHVSLADPYCPVGREVAVRTAAADGWQPLDGGTLVVIQGPRFSTRAESRWFASAGWSVVGMTGYPEAALARELALCYTAVTLVTDTDAGIVAGEAVSHAEVLRVFAEHITRLRGLLGSIVESLPTTRSCPCPHALDDLHPTLALP